MDNVDLKKDYDVTVSSDSKLVSNSIKMRKESFENTYNKWLAQLNKKTEDAVSDLQNGIEIAQNSIESHIEDSIVDGEKVKDIEDRVVDYTTKLAKIEEKVTVLSRSNGPFEGVGERAIRLKDKMIKNALDNVEGIYKIIDSKEDVTNVGTEISVERASKENGLDISDSIEKGIDAVEKPLDLDAIKSIFDNSFSEIEKNKIIPSDVEESVSDDNVEEKIEPIADGVVIPADAEESTPEDSFLDSKAIMDLVNGKIKEDENSNETVTEVDTEVEMNVEKDDTEIPRRTIYVPLTDEEIAKSREKIELNKYEEINKNDPVVDSEPITLPAIHGVDEIEVKNDEPIRDEVVVVDDNSNEEIKEIGFDYSDATPIDLVNAAKIETNVTGLEALKARAAELKEDKRRAMEEEELAKKEQTAKEAEANEYKRMTEEKEAKANEYKRLKEEKEKEYQASVSRFESYIANLSSDVEDITASAKNIREQNANTDKFIEESKIKIEGFDKTIIESNAKVEDYDSKMSEIAAMMGNDESYSEDESIKVK